MCLPECRLSSHLREFSKHTAQLQRGVIFRLLLSPHENLMSSSETRQKKPVGQLPCSWVRFVSRETMMVKLLSKKIITAEALLAAGGRSVKDKETGDYT